MADKNKPDSDDGLEIDSINGDTQNSPAGNSEQLNNLRKEVEESKNAYLYLRADFENYKSQAIRERAEIAKFGAERLIVSLVDVLDTLDRALQMEITPENYVQFKEGMEMTSKELLATLSRFGVQEMDPAGLAFDPNLHEALSSEETDAVPPGHISRVFKKAYKMHDRLIRPAQVVVAKEPSNTSEPEA